MTEPASQGSPLGGRGATIAVEVVVNLAAPWLIYKLAAHDLGEVNALIASSAPPLVWSLVQFIRDRRIDALSAIVLAGIVLSLVSYVGVGSVKALQLRDKAVTGVIGLAFLVSALIRRPLIWPVARAMMRRQSDAHLERLDSVRELAGVKRMMMVMTLVWGFGLAADAAVGAVMVTRLSVADYLLASPIQGYAFMGALGLWTFLYVRRESARLRAARGDLRPSRRPSASSG